MNRFIWAAALIATAVGPAFTNDAHIEATPYYRGVAGNGDSTASFNGWYCDWVADTSQAPVYAFKSFADLNGGVGNYDNGGSNACQAYHDSAAFAFIPASAGAWTIRVHDDFERGARDSLPDVNTFHGAARCCGIAQIRLFPPGFYLNFGNAHAVPELSTRTIMLLGFAGLGLATYSRTIRRRTAPDALARASR